MLKSPVIFHSLNLKSKDYIIITNMKGVFTVKRKILIALVLVMAGLLSLALREEKEFTRHGSAMNTLIRITVYSHSDDALNDAYSMLNDIDAKMSMFNPSSEIYKINELAGKKDFRPSKETLTVIQDSLKLYKITDGVFNPLIGAVTKLWKINQPTGVIPSQESIDIALNLTKIENVSISADSVYLKHEGCFIDLGGISKGYASRAIADMLRHKGVKSAIIDLGGNIFALGKKTDGSNWKIGIRNPLDPAGSPLAAVSVNDCAVITSGNYERYKIIDGKKYSHFFDPETGKSVMSNLLSVTLITPDGSLGDGLATAFMICGIEKAKEILSRPDVPDNTGAVFVTQGNDGKPEVFATENLKDIIISAVDVKFF